MFDLFNLTVVLCCMISEPAGPGVPPYRHSAHQQHVSPPQTARYHRYSTIAHVVLARVGD